MHANFPDSYFIHKDTFLVWFAAFPTKIGSVGFGILSTASAIPAPSSMWTAWWTPSRPWSRTATTRPSGRLKISTHSLVDVSVFRSHALFSRIFTGYPSNIYFACLSSQICFFFASLFPRRPISYSLQIALCSQAALSS